MFNPFRSWFYAVVSWTRDETQTSVAAPCVRLAFVLWSAAADCGFQSRCYGLYAVSEHWVELMEETLKHETALFNVVI